MIKAMTSAEVASVPGKGSGAIGQLLSQFAESKDPKIREELIVRHANLVRKLVGRFANGSKRLDSLVSVGTIGLMCAVDRYDISKGASFITYATHCILGEVKRYLRDNSWLLKVPRSVKTLNWVIHHTIENLTMELGRSPTISEIGERVSIPPETVAEIMEAGHSYTPYSLDQQLGWNGEDTFCLSDCLSQDDKELCTLIDKIELKEVMGRLNKREQMILQLFYSEGYSQTEISKRLRMSQMHVSRLLRQAIGNLRKFMEG